MMDMYRKFTQQAPRPGQPRPQLTRPGLQPTPRWSGYPSGQQPGTAPSRFQHRQHPITAQSGFQQGQLPGKTHQSYHEARRLGSSQVQQAPVSQAYHGHLGSSQLARPLSSARSLSQGRLPSATPRSLSSSHLPIHEQSIKESHSDVEWKRPLLGNPRRDTTSASQQNNFGKTWQEDKKQSTQRFHKYGKGDQASFDDREYSDYSAVDYTNSAYKDTDPYHISEDNSASWVEQEDPFSSGMVF